MEADSFPSIPPFPTSIPTAPLLRISLAKLLHHDPEEEERLWTACCDLGFFYLDLRTNHPAERMSGASTGGTNNGTSTTSIDGSALLKDADELFDVGRALFELPIEEKQQFDFAKEGSYFGYKGYGAGIIDKSGSRDRNEFYNVSKDDILGVSSRLPCPDMLNQHRDLLQSYMTTSHAVITKVLSILNARLALPSGTLEGLHRLHAVSGDQVRFIRAPPQPKDDRRTALGAHTDFGSVTVLFNRVGGLQVRLPEGIEAIAAAPSSPLSWTSSSSQAPHSDSDAEESKRQASNEEHWVYVRPLPGHAIINLGDALVKFSGGILRSNIHRVVSPPGLQAETTRFSLVYFARAEDDVPLRALRESEMVRERVGAGKDGEEEEEVLSSKEWILRRALGRRGIGAFSEGTEEARGVKG